MRKKNVLILLLCTCSFLYGQNKYNDIEFKMGELDTFTLLSMMDTYYFYYYDFPKDIYSFIDFHKEVVRVYPNDCKVDTLNISFLDVNKDKINIIKKGKTAMIMMDGKVLLNAGRPILPFDVYKSIYFIQDYYVILEKYPTRYYKDDKAIIKTNKFDYIFEQEKKNLQLKYFKNDKYCFPTFSLNNEEYPIFNFFEFKTGNLYYFPSGENFNSNLPFWMELNKFLQNFSRKHNIDRIIFYLPEYKTCT